MKFNKKYLNLSHWIVFLKRQPTHMQHVYALVFAGSVTLLLAVIILYFDYGFWRDKYSRSDTLAKEEMISSAPNEPKGQSPSALIGSFLEEASLRFRKLNYSKNSLLESKDVYRQDEATTSQNVQVESFQK